ncbi:putative glutamyl-tRNA(Gln) amidotransferase subunit [Oceanicola granulosus HTCC2516]|uniref:Putative glutamyl-tRNA(Gln) amidotransferase subunit n=1 Tax=Oceanicola granulosus (strain ATCC BAA-861 / DSM 15982 / KCTC 12143 / HTCC2516) TaxID=314256 RepID=Q2CH73_OCEGH|nr:putative glutamyl-tRNA(Gln) amidotransferase subunit [Oceanicola granulosus HTCC2516]
MPAHALRAGYAAGDFTPLDALEACHARTDEVNGRLTALVAEDRALAAEQAGRATERWAAQAPLSLLDGVPITIKDNLHAAGLPATWGSRLHDGHRPQADEPALARLRERGAVFLGKTNVPEFTLHGYTDNPLFGPSRNPLAPALTPGGSTGGGAAGCAAGIGAIAIGTDGGGSTRRPAAHCGLWGFKPSVGLTSRRGGFPQILADFEVIGALARAAADLLPAIDLLSDIGLPRTDRFAQPLRIGLFTAAGGRPVEPRIAAAVERLAEAFAAAGAEVTPVAAPFEPESMNAAFGTIAQAGLAWHLDGVDGWEAQVGAPLAEMARAGAALTGAQVYAAMAACHAMRWQARAAFEACDLLLCPTTAALAWPATGIYPPIIAGRPADARGHALFTTWVNIAGLPAASVPLGETPDAGGIGAQLITPPGRDHALLDLMITHPALAALAAHDPEKEIP